MFNQYNTDAPSTFSIKHEITKLEALIEREGKTRARLIRLRNLYLRVQEANKWQP